LRADCCRQERELEVDDEICVKPVMTFPIKKRINTELFIDRTPPLYKPETGLGMIKKGSQPVKPAS